MKLLGLEVQRARKGPRSYGTVETVLDRATADTGVVGLDSSDASYYDAFEGGPDVNPELMGRAKYPVYREMRMTDPAVRSLAWMIKLPVRAAEWTLVPAKEDPDGDAGARLRADAAAWLFGLERFEGQGRLAQTWDEWLVQDLFFLDYGSQGGEIVFPTAGRGRVRVETWVDADGDEHDLIPIARIAPRFAATIGKIETDRETGLISRIRQDVNGVVGEGWIPGRKITWIANEPEGSNLYGQSLFRSAYGAWTIKKNTFISGAIALDRFGSPTPKVRHPPGSANEQKAEEIGENLRVHERAWVTLEGPPPPQGGWDVDLISPNGQIPDPVNFLRYCDQQIAMAGLQQFSSLGTTQTGSRAVGEVISDPFYLHVQTVAKQLAEARMKVLRRWFDLNFGERVPIPTVSASKIQGKNVAVLARALADLSAAGFAFTDRDTQNDVRDILDLRHLPDVQAVVDGLPDDVGLAVAPGRRAPVEGGSVVGAIA